MPAPAELEFKLPDTAVTLSLRPTTAAELSRLLRKSNNKTCGLAPSPTGLLNYSPDSHLPAILAIFNGCLKHCVFPEVFKQADVTPILKKPKLDEQQLSTYRPVSNLPYLGKLLSIWWRSGSAATSSSTTLARGSSQPTRHITPQRQH